METKDLIKILRKVNKKADIQIGNYTYFLTHKNKNYPNELYIDGDTWKLLNEKTIKNFKKIETIIIWVSE